jgi:cell division septal protein FtsQ
MARFRTKKQKGKPRRKKSAAERPVVTKKHIATGIVILVILITLGGGYWILLKSPYFNVAEVVFSEKRDPSSVDYYGIEKMLSGRNMFSLDLDEIELSIKTEYPELKALMIVRQFPGRVVMEMRYRTPIAQIKSGQYYLVDREGVILPGVTLAERENYPVIDGVSTWIERLVGKRCDSVKLTKALYLIQRMYDTGLFEGHILHEVDVANTKNISFYLEDGLEVKIGGEDFSARLERLVRLLADPKVRPEEIRYIDLRFKDPVINPKWIR